MKKIGSFVLSVIMSLAVFAADPTQPPSGGGSGSNSKMPASLAFLSSRAALCAFAIESARQVNLNLESSGMEGSWGTGTSWEGPQGSQTILDAINAWKFVFNVNNPKDYVRATADIKNSDWDTLFSANSGGIPEPVDSEVYDSAYELPQLYFYFTMENLIPFKVDRSIQSGQIMYVNDDGKTITTIDLDVRDGKVYFRSDLAGKGILVLHDKNWNAYLYNLRHDGVRVPVSRVQYSGSHSSIDGLFTYKNQQVVKHKIWSSNGIGRNPTFEVSLGLAVSIHMDVYTSEGARAIGYQARMQGTTNWNFHPAPSNADTPIPLDNVNKIYYIVPVWNPEEFKEPDPYIYDDYYGPFPVYPGKG